MRTKDAPNLAPISDSDPNPNSIPNPDSAPVSGSDVVSVSIEEKSTEEKTRALSVAEEANLKSSLKRPNGERKGNVKWMDFLGKDLVETKEFEPRYALSFSSTLHLYLQFHHECSN